MTMHQFTTFYLPITVTLFVTLLSSYLLAAICARLTKSAHSISRDTRRAALILGASNPTWKFIRLAGGLAGLGTCLWLYPAARNLLLALH